MRCIILLAEWKGASVIELDRLKEALLYVSSMCEGDEKFGAVKLNKILYYADFQAYRESGRSVTGATYQHLPEGPAPRELLAARKELIDEGALTIESRQVFSYIQQRPVAKRAWNPEAFQDWEDDKRILDAAIEFLAPYWGYEVSKISHDEWGYRLTQEGEDIPYRTAWLSPESTQDDLAAAIAVYEWAAIVNPPKVGRGTSALKKTDSKRR